MAFASRVGGNSGAEYRAHTQARSGRVPHLCNALYRVLRFEPQYHGPGGYCFALWFVEQWAVATTFGRPVMTRSIVRVMVLSVVGVGAAAALGFADLRPDDPRVLVRAAIEDLSNHLADKDVPERAKKI